MKIANSLAKLSLAAALALTLTVNVDARSWDFRHWSAATVANLKAVNIAGTAAESREWSDVEKKGDTEPTDATRDNCFWSWGDLGSTTEDKYVTANGEVIKELEGLYYTLPGNIGSLAIAINYPSTSLGTYEGPSYLWFGGSKKNYFVIPNVAPGTIIKSGVESHKSTDARGIELYVGRGTSGTKLLDPDGNAVAIPTTYQDLTWMVPEDIDASLLNEDGNVDIQIYNTNGCHIYYLEVEEGDVVEEAKSIAYVTNSAADGGFDDAKMALEGASDRIELTTIESTEAISLDSLKTYEAVVISPFVAAGDAIAATLRSAIAYQPVLNLNSTLAEAWGLVTVKPAETTAVTVAEAFAESELFANMTLDENTLTLLAEGNIQAVELGDYFKNDLVLATADENVAIHQHNSSRNTYIYLPVNAESIVEPEAYGNLVVNAAVYAADTKRSVTAASAPAITTKAGDGITTVTISLGTADAVYYTIDGTEPTEASTLYDGAFTTTEPITVKAIAVADGYYNSPVASANVVIAAQAAAPSISIEKLDGKSIVRIKSDVEGTIMYSYNDPYDADGNLVAKRFGPWGKSNGVAFDSIAVKEPTYIYAYVIPSDEAYIASDVASEYVGVNGVDASNIRLDVIGHFSSDSSNWPSTSDALESIYTGDANLIYYWGKTAWSMYTDEVLSQTPVLDENGEQKYTENEAGEKIPEYNYTYAVNPDAYKEILPINDTTWKLTSWGQVIRLYTKKDVSSASVGEVNEDGNCAHSPESVLGGMYLADGTTSVISSGHRLDLTSRSSDSGDAAVESTVTYPAPFDVVVYHQANGNKCALEVSEDGKTWETIDYVPVMSKGPSNKFRGFNRDRFSVEKTGNYYVRLANKNGSTFGLYDMYILNNGELSKAYVDPTAGQSGVENVIATEATEVVATEIYNLNGIRLSALQDGINIVRTTYADGTVKVAKILK